MKTRNPLLATALSICTGIASVNAAQIYLDAPTVGTTAGDVSFTGTAGTWVERTTGPAANAFATTAQQGTGGAGPLTSTITVGGLQAISTYTGFRIYYVGKAATNAADNWDFNYSYTGGTGIVLDEISGTIIDISNGGVGAPATTTGDIRYFVSVPDFTTDGAGSISVDFARPTLDRDGNPSDDRFVIDGVGFETIAVPEPSSALLAFISGGLFLVRRKR